MACGRHAAWRHARRCAIVNRTQALVVVFFLMVFASLVVIRAAAPEVYDQALRLPTAWPRWAGIAFLIGLSAFIALLCIGVLRRWRWIFWLILVAFLSGVLRVPVAILQFAGVMSAGVPGWYVVFQGLIGLAQFAIGLAMLAGYRRSGVWGAV
jgi:cell division protein FtsW (lipid II flippase)